MRELRPVSRYRQAVAPRDVLTRAAIARPGTVALICADGTCDGATTCRGHAPLHPLPGEQIVIRGRRGRRVWTVVRSTADTVTLARTV